MSVLVFHSPSPPRSTVLRARRSVRVTGGAPRGHARTIKTSWLTSPRYFAAYEVTKKALTPAGHTPAELHLGSIITAGGMAGVAMWAIAIPPDVR